MHRWGGEVRRDTTIVTHIFRYNLNILLPKISKLTYPDSLKFSAFFGTLNVEKFQKMDFPESFFRLL